MVWGASPRTWTSGELITAAMMNADVRDKLDVLRVADGDSVGTQAADNVIGAIPLLFRIDIAAGANADKNSVMTHKVRVLDAWVVLRQAGIASAVMEVKNGATAITGVMAVSGADMTISRPVLLNDGFWEIAAGGQLRVTGSGGATMPACTVYVWAVRVA